MKLYQGLSSAVWSERLVAAGWPPRAANRMAEWLTQGGHEPPLWGEMVPAAGLEPASLEGDEF